MEQPTSEPTSPPTEHDAISVRYVPNEEDVVQFNLHFVATSPVHRKQKRVLLLMGALLLTFIGVVAVVSGSPREMLIRLWPAAAAAVLLVALYFVALKHRIRRMVLRMQRDRPSRAVGNPVTLTICPRDVRESWRYGERVWRWPAFHKLTQLDDVLYMFVDSGAAITVPLRAFENRGAFDQFAEAAKRWHRVVDAGRCEGCSYDLFGNTSGVCPECGRKIEFK